LYEDRILPHLTHLAMRRGDLLPYRKRLLAGAKGRVLEIGIGSGINLPLYPVDLVEVVGVDPASRLLAKADGAAKRAAIPVRLVEGSAESIPLEDRSIDTIVSTWTLCTIPDVARALAEMRRVVKPGGRLLFVEHGQSPDASVRAWQDRLTPLWKWIGGGCHLNRSIQVLIESGGFRMDHLETGYLKGRNPMSYMYEGIALPL
jgi:ubiquinone/menaquinone biosynthesis C-methylase UbiE